MVQDIKRTPPRVLHMLRFVHFVHSEMKLSVGITDTVGGQERIVIDFPATKMLSYVHIHIYIHFVLLNCIRMHNFFLRFLIFVFPDTLQRASKCSLCHLRRELQVLFTYINAVCSFTLYFKLSWKKKMTLFICQ